jgi:hypothetical protein
LLFHQVDVEPVEYSELGQSIQVYIHEVIRGEGEIGTLEHPEEFQSHNFAADERQEQHGITSHLECLNNTLHNLHTLTLGIRIVGRRNKWIIVDPQALTL